MRLEHMMYKQGLQELGLSSMRKTVQGDVTPRPEEALWRCYRLFLELCKQKDKWQWSQVAIWEIPARWKENLPLKKWFSTGTAWQNAWGTSSLGDTPNSSEVPEQPGRSLRLAYLWASGCWTWWPPDIPYKVFLWFKEWWFTRCTCTDLSVLTQGPSLTQKPVWR